MTEKNNIIPQSLFVFLAYRICPLVLKLQNASTLVQPNKFLNDNNARWTISRVYGKFCRERKILEKLRC